MARSHEFTHGGSVGKNLGLLFRSILNILAFGVLWAGLLQLASNEVLFGSPEDTPMICTIVGGGATVLLLFVNLFLPWAHRAKGGKR